MRGPEFPLLLTCCALLLAACSKSPAIKPPRIKGVEEVAEVRRFEDGQDTRRRVQIRDMLGLAAQRFASGDLTEAERQAHKVLKLDPATADAHTLLGAVEDRRGNAGAAGEYYRRAAELAPQRGDVLNNYGAWLCANGHPAEALVWFDRAVADPGYQQRADALANAGGCALEAGQGERAGQDLRQALELDPDNAYALEAMARNEFRLGRYFEARAFYQRRLAAAPATVSVLQLAIQIEERLGDSSAVSRYQQRLREEFPAGATPNSQG